MKRKELALILSACLLFTGFGNAISSKAGTNTTTDSQTTATVASDSAITYLTPPDTPTIDLIKGGSKRVKLYWNKVSDANGYNIYYSTSKNGTYEKIKTINDNTTVKYVKTGLTQKKTYYFKITAFKTQYGLTAESDFSTIKSAKTGSVDATSKSAKKYSSKTKYKKSPAYKKYAALSKYSTYSKTFKIPGMKNTNAGGFASKKMIPQGICQAGGYMLISAYDYTGYDESVIYVLSRSSHSYITTILLPSRAKVESLAYDGENIWISKGSNIAYFPYSVVTDAVSSGKSYYSLDNYTDYFTLKTRAGIIAYHDNVLWVGNSGSTSSTMYGYTLSTVDNKITLTNMYSMKIPARTQGITFDSEGYMYMTRAYRTNSSKSGYLSRMQVYKPSFTTPSSKGSIAKGAIVKKVTLPPKSEGVTVYGKYQYTLYSGCQYSSCKYPVDRVIATKLTKLR